ncbi:rhamnan synthesis F family protein [Neptunicella sp.]|uniref:rhamnan synthesis F family protein n=1 Tax=Neptunicella sp. TaxID=2125986 RepID=UPI003F68EECD
MPDNHSHNSSLFYLCTGFHRSGTSLVAQTLADNGMRMGNELMGASFSNPLGHVEDLPVVRLHDKIFSINGVDWRYHDHAPLVKPNWLSNYINRYCVEKRNDTDLNGVKDPRAVFFLKDWHHALGPDLRCIFIYRHWSTACHSLFKRHSRHLINSVPAMVANKLNFSFWQHPDLAFDMWRTSNKRLLEFYHAHPDKCLLISQQAFVDNNLRVQQCASKIGLSANNFICENYRPTLMTENVQQSTINMLSTEQRQQLDDLWFELEQNADVACGNVPEIVKDKWFPAPRHFTHKSRPERRPIVLTPFNLAELSWQECFGFLVRIPTNRTDQQLFAALFKRHFTSVENYQTLAQITHKVGDYLSTKLAKMRAMQVDCQSWRIADWRLFTDDDRQWITKDSTELPQGNPFSLRPKTDLTKRETKFTFDLDKDWSVFLDLLQDKPRSVVADWLIGGLLYKACNDAQVYQAIAHIAIQHKLYAIAEFSVLYGMRLQQDAINTMTLGDVYRATGLIEPARACFMLANRFEQDEPGILARLADVCLTAGEYDDARIYLKQAGNIEPNHPVVEFCQQRMTPHVSSDPQQETTSTMDLSPMLMPDNEHYENVVNLMRTDYLQGKQRDQFYRQNAFVQRHNRQWLGAGLQHLAPRSQINLCSHIYSHWRTLFKPAVLATELELASQPAPEQINVEKAAHLKLKTAVTLFVNDVSLLSELFCFIENISAAVDLYLFVEPDNYIKLQQVLEQSSIQSLPIVTTSNQPTEQMLLQTELELVNGYQLVCRLTTLSLDGNKPLANWRLQLLFSLLGTPELVETIVDKFVQEPQLGLVCAPYHKAWANKLAEEIQRWRVHSGLGDSLVELWPVVGGMFWYRPAALRTFSEAEHQLEDAMTWQLPVSIYQNDFYCRFSHRLDD